MAWYLRCMMLLLVAVVLPACATDSDAVLNDQNIEAGAYIESHSLQPDVKQAGKDVKLNSQTLAKNVTGDAPVALKKPYTPENSKVARDDSDKSHTSTWWPWISGALALMLPIVFQIARSHPLGAVVASLIEPYAKKLLTIHTAAEEHPDDTVHRDVVSNQINDLLSNPKTGQIMAEMITKVGLEKSIPQQAATPEAQPGS